MPDTPTRAPLTERSRCGIHGYPTQSGRCFRCDELATVAEAARRYAAMVESDLAGGEIGDGYTYATERDTVESFMLAGNGPTVWARFIFADFRRREIRTAFIEYASGGVSALHEIPEYRAADLLAALRRDAEAQR